jgi:hypothetical protein
VAGAPSLSGSWGPRWDHTLCALVNDLRVGARHARPPVGHILPATCGNALPPFSGVKWSQVQIAALAAVGLRLADPIPQRLGQTFNCSASRRITGVGSDSRYNRTARSGNSTGYLLFAASKTSFLGLQDQTCFGSLRKNRGTTHRAQLRGFGYSDNDRVDPSDSVPRMPGWEARHGCILRGARVRDHPANEH